MKRSNVETRCWLQALGVLIALVTITSPLLLGVHAHEDGHRGDTCPICTCAHMPAIDRQSVTIPTPPSCYGERLATPLASPILPSFRALTQSRAPPSV